MNNDTADFLSSTNVTVCGSGTVDGFDHNTCCPFLTIRTDGVN